MNVLILGGTKFFGKNTVQQLLLDDHKVTVATRGLVYNPFGKTTEHIIFDHRDEKSIQKAFSNKRYDVVIDKIAFSSNDIKRVLKNIDCRKFILMSTCGVYNGKYHPNILENEFDPYSYPLVWEERDANGGIFDYDEGKRQSECALANLKRKTDCIMVRFPVVLGKNDYTNRLFFYVEHIVKGIPINITNYDNNISFIDEEDAGSFFAKAINTSIYGPVNGCSKNSIKIKAIINYIENKTNSVAIIDKMGDYAPFNGFYTDTTYSIKKAEEYGITFKNHEDWIYTLIDYYIDSLK